VILGREIPIDAVVELSGVLGGVGHGHTLRPVGVAEARAKPLSNKVIVDISMMGAIGKCHTGYLGPSSIFNWRLVMRYQREYAALGFCRGFI
jgi:hypothetical protein